MAEHLAVVRDLAVAAARAGGEVLRESYGRVPAVRFKAEFDLVTEVDVRAERSITDLIRDRFPRHRILAEEGTLGGDDPAHRWLIDPLDGTTNYAHGVPAFCVSVGYELEGRMAVGVIYDPNLEELFVAEAGRGATLNGQPLAVSGTVELGRALLTTGFPYDRNRLGPALAQFGALSQRSQAVRRIGSAALDLAWLAAGRFDGYWETVVSPWDVAAGWLIAAEAGARITDLAGVPFAVDAGQIVASNGRLHDALLEALAPATRAAH
ncbi:MAG TPA: inositol monophosphatase family protein [Chloroflexota bacterium]|nr:inositol monophosphatase family protein [Chloroflexota bacterium]